MEIKGLLHVNCMDLIDESYALNFGEKGNYVRSGLGHIGWELNDVFFGCG